MPSAPCHYERLGVSRAADAETLRQAFRRRSKALHPDTTTLPAMEAADQFQQLRQSYELLADPQRRRSYDEQLEARLKRTPSVSNQPAAVQLAPDGIGERRPLSGGEWFSLLLLLSALALCLLIGLGVASVRGREWQVSPEWLAVEQTPLVRPLSDQTQDLTAVHPQDVNSPVGPDASEPAFVARP